jgi:hypothetical protein
MFQLEYQRFVRAGFGILPLIGTLAGVVAQADQAQYRVVVSERDSAGVPNSVRYRGEGLATQMFARIGAAVEWLGRHRDTHKHHRGTCNECWRRAQLRPTILIAMAVVGMSARAEQADQKVEQEVNVYLQNDASVPSPVLSQARALAAKMFADVGVRIDWRRGQQAESQLLEEGAITVHVTTSFDVRHGLRRGYAPEELKPNSGAFAFPNEGIHITVLYDRLAWSEKRPGFAHVLLAHVLVHEITHMLQGICRHSTAGIMKANWTLDDYYDMQAKTIPFASEDVELIHNGMNQRYARAEKTGASTLGRGELDLSGR